MELQILEGGSLAGTLSVSVQGLYMLFEARVAGAGTGLSRLWLRGEGGGAASLGLLEPRTGGRFLRRRLSRLERQKLPPRPWTALVLPAEERPSRTAPVEATLAVAREQASIPGIREERAVCSGTGDQETKSGPPRALGPAAKKAGPPPHSAFRTPHSEISWLRLSDGSLRDPARRLLALPWAGGELPAAARKISVDGRDYLVFRY